MALLVKVGDLEKVAGANFSQLLTLSIPDPLTIYFIGCPSADWIIVNDRCYLTSPTKMNWQQAQQVRRDICEG